jgi:hypothetical protein
MIFTGTGSGNYPEIFWEFPENIPSEEAYFFIFDIDQLFTESAGDVKIFQSISPLLRVAFRVYQKSALADLGVEALASEPDNVPGVM